MPDDSEKPWLGHEDDLLFVNDAANRELEDYARRDGAMQSRASILVGAASLVGAIQLSNGLEPATTVNTVLSVGHLALSFVAALAGVVMLFPRSGDAFDAGKLRDELLRGTSKEEATFHMVRVKLENLEVDEKSLKLRGKVAKVGFISLALGVLLAGMTAIAPTPAMSSPVPPPTSTVSNVP